MKTFKTAIKSLFNNNTWLILIATIGILTLCFNEKAMAQHKDQIVRIAKIEVDPAQIEQYNTALKEQMTTAVRVEPGVLTYYAVADKATPSHITIFEIYADTAAYQAHIQTPHFKKYKATVEHIVTKLELEDVRLVRVAKKPEM
ncbi:putative quinol monooxygenase [Mucilaginibacter jinjuensis]|uniref:Quinol monooxygenase n=1 Tax=Mucilaginibacter jinjuensis TaxID=1176721 RepID=A0ABY7TAZ5_9SPHI|nr:putative quinol monooxygenase [Mucilaginibacter jinjuensis]WCT12397.1 putative quinol monooxygenase [Mucilaginibacter jinjuensis]